MTLEQHKELAVGQKMSIGGITYKVVDVKSFYYNGEYNKTSWVIEKEANEE